MTGSNIFDLSDDAVTDDCNVHGLFIFCDLDYCNSLQLRLTASLGSKSQHITLLYVSSLELDDATISRPSCRFL